MKAFRTRLAFACLTLVGALGAADALAAPTGCSGTASNITAVGDTSNIQVFSLLQDTNPANRFQRVLSTTMNSGRGCFAAHLSGMARITDNYVAFQVRVDGNPVAGGQQLTGTLNPDTPIVYVGLDEGVAPYNDEQFSDPTKVVSYNFYGNLGAGTHVVEVFAAAGSGVDPNNPPSVGNLVLTLEHP
jgi:hypothetical protein